MVCVLLTPITSCLCQEKRDALMRQYWPAEAIEGPARAVEEEGEQAPVEAFADEVDLGPVPFGSPGVRGGAPRAQSRLRRSGPRVPVSALAGTVPDAALSDWVLEETEEETAAREAAEEVEREKNRLAAEAEAARRAAEQAAWEAATAKERAQREAEEKKAEEERRAKEEAEEEVRREREAAEKRLREERERAAREAKEREKEREKERRRRREEEERRAKEEAEQRALDADPLREVMEKRLKHSAVAPPGSSPEEPRSGEDARVAGDLEHTLGLTAARCAVSHTWGLRWEAIRGTERSLPLLVKLRRKEDVAAACAALIVRAIRDTVPKVSCAGARLARTLFDTGRDLPQDAAGAGQTGGAEAEDRAVLPPLLTGPTARCSLLACRRARAGRRVGKAVRAGGPAADGERRPGGDQDGSLLFCSWRAGDAGWQGGLSLLGHPAWGGYDGEEGRRASGAVRLRGAALWLRAQAGATSAAPPTPLSPIPYPPRGLGAGRRAMWCRRR